MACGTCEVVLRGHDDCVLAVSVLADGRAITGSCDHTARVWDLSSGTCEMVLRGHDNWLEAVSALADGRALTASSDGTVKVWK